MAAETTIAAPGAGFVKEVGKRPYVPVFAVLAVVTFIELNVNGFVFNMTTLLGLSKLETISILVMLATIKGSLVVAYYMHLRYEPRWLALIPLGGLALVAVLVAALTATSAHP